jgi:hypothetical protein
LDDCAAKIPTTQKHKDAVASAGIGYVHAYEIAFDFFYRRLA